MEPLLLAEVAHAVAGMARKEANDIVLKIIDKYEPLLENPPLGASYDTCFDINTRTPKDNALENYKHVRNYLNNIGIDISEPSPYL